MSTMFGCVCELSCLQAEQKTDRQVQTDRHKETAIIKSQQAKKNCDTSVKNANSAPVLKLSGKIGSVLSLGLIKSIY